MIKEGHLIALLGLVRLLQLLFELRVLFFEGFNALLLFFHLGLEVLGFVLLCLLRPRESLFIHPQQTHIFSQLHHIFGKRLHGSQFTRTSAFWQALLLLIPE